MVSYGRRIDKRDAMQDHKTHTHTHTLIEADTHTHIFNVRQKVCNRNFFLGHAHASRMRPIQSAPLLMELTCLKM